MNTTNITDVAGIPAVSHTEAMDLQATELERSLDLLRGLSPEQWSTQTDCPDWDVRRMWLHVLGACEAGASTRENMHQMRLGRKMRKERGVSLEEGLSATQSNSSGPDRARSPRPDSALLRRRDHTNRSVDRRGQGPLADD
jgi:hypothetical protein